MEDICPTLDSGGIETKNGTTKNVNKATATHQNNNVEMDDQEAKNLKINGCLCDVVLKESNGHAKDNQNSDELLGVAGSIELRVNGTIPMAEQNAEDSRLDSHDSESSHNSTDNLSLCTDFDFEDMMMIQNNGDDDISTNSDDCVYAYRGGVDFEPPAPIDLDPGDDTDYLEMDFEPDPVSENESVLVPQMMSRNQSQEPTTSSVNKEETTHQLNEPSTSNGECSSTMEPSCSYMQSQPGPSSSSSGTSNKYTGTKPKTSRMNGSSSSSESKRGYSKSYNSMSSVSNSYDYYGEQPTCSKFFADDLRRKCKLNGQNSTVSMDVYTNGHEIENHINSDINDTFQSERQLVNSYQNPAQFSYIENPEDVILIPVDNLDYAVIHNAMEQLKLPFDSSELELCFIHRHARDVEITDLIEYLIFMSKKKCDYKALKELLLQVCPMLWEHYFIEFQPCYSTDTEWIKVPCSEILDRWNETTNLRRILTIQNKKFHTANVLGKVANIVRQSSKRYIKEDVFIEIPQYYRSGYIRLTKLG